MDWSAVAWTFETERLRIIPWRDRGEQELVRFLTEALTPEVTKHLPLSWQEAPSEDEAGPWIAAREESGTLFLALSKEDDRPVGFLMFFVQDSNGGPAEVRVGYVLAENSWGRGYASELLQGFTALWDQRRPKALLLAGVTRDNAASRRVLEKAGFKDTAPAESSDPLEYERP